MADCASIRERFQACSGDIISQFDVFIDSNVVWLDEQLDKVVQAQRRPERHVLGDILKTPGRSKIAPCPRSPDEMQISPGPQPIARLFQIAQNEEENQPTATSTSLDTDIRMASPPRASPHQHRLFAVAKPSAEYAPPPQIVPDTVFASATTETHNSKALSPPESSKPASDLPSTSPVRSSGKNADPVEDVGVAMASISQPVGSTQVDVVSQNTAVDDQRSSCVKENTAAKIAEPASPKGGPKLPPSPTSSFLTSNGARASFLRFQGLPSREQNTTIIPVRREGETVTIPFSHREKSFGSSLIADNKREKSLGSVLVSTNKRDDVNAVPPQSRIEALRHRVQSMSKGMHASRPSVDPQPVHVPAPTPKAELAKKPSVTDLVMAFETRVQSSPSKVPRSSPSKLNLRNYKADSPVPEVPPMPASPVAEIARPQTSTTPRGVPRSPAVEEIARNEAFTPASPPKPSLAPHEAPPTMLEDNALSVKSLDCEVAVAPQSPTISHSALQAISPSPKTPVLTSKSISTTPQNAPLAPAPERLPQSPQVAQPVVSKSPRSAIPIPKSPRNQVAAVAESSLAKAPKASLTMSTKRIATEEETIFIEHEEAPKKRKIDTEVKRPVIKPKVMSLSRAPSTVSLHKTPSIQSHTTSSIIKKKVNATINIAGAASKSFAKAESKTATLTSSMSKTKAPSSIVRPVTNIAPATTVMLAQATKSNAMLPHASDKPKPKTQGPPPSASSSRQTLDQQVPLAVEMEPFVDLPDIASEYSDSDEETQAAKAAKLPDWAQSPNLRAQLLAQSTIDPDTIFGPIQPLDMGEIFKGGKAARFRVRSSSAHWSGADMLSRDEQIAYAARMNFSTS